MFKVITIVVAMIAFGCVASADTLAETLEVPSLELSILQGVTPEYSTGISLSYPFLTIKNDYEIFADVCLLSDVDMNSKGFLGGFSTDAPIPLLRNLSIDTRVGFGFSSQSDDWLFYLRVPIF